MRLAPKSDLSITCSAEPPSEYHGIKVFALCCSYSAYLLGFEDYVGTEYTEDGGWCDIVENNVIF